jgi:hypothetical protein
VQDYSRQLEAAGFVDGKAEDCTAEVRIERLACLKSVAL